MCHGDTLGKENKMKNYNGMNDFDETNKNTKVSENTEKKNKDGFAFFDFNLGIFAKAISALFVLFCHAIAFARCFKTLEANDDSAIKFFMVVLMFAVIVSGLLFIISFAKNEVEK